MTGHVNDVTPYIQLILVNATEVESAGIALPEATALAVGVGGSGGPLELIEPGRSGLLTDGPDPDALAAGVAELVTDADLRRRLAEEDRRTAARFSARRMAEDIQARLEGLVA